jgi:hypothetical protein
LKPTKFRFQVTLINIHKMKFARSLFQTTSINFLTSSLIFSYYRYQKEEQNKNRKRSIKFILSFSFQAKMYLSSPFCSFSSIFLPRLRFFCVSFALCEFKTLSSTCVFLMECACVRVNVNLVKLIQNQNMHLIKYVLQQAYKL